jgi:hypothetical protein
MVAPFQGEGDSRDDDPIRYFMSMMMRAYRPFESTGLPLCITEFGYLAGYGLEDQLYGVKPPFFPPPYDWAENITATQQAVWLANAIKSLGEINNMSEISTMHVRMVMIWRINGMPLNPFMSGYAIIRPDGSCLACKTIAGLKQ